MGPTAFQARTGFVLEEQGHPGSTERLSAGAKEQMVRKSDLKKGQMCQQGELGKSPGFWSAREDEAQLPTAVGPPVRHCF